ncbi:FAD-binding oxidoreductase [Pseudomonas sp. PCH199]|uniref:FAD-binding oxidoreductase n=1 Tax=unclassified Pseudomonas TaxID=196821 RepID=UPI000BCD0E26|nr:MULTISPECIES: FAD-binding oxidoreductase [unclassified Pseudomonas]MCW8277368.1 FAD-binding oxidoreductase [Pseudomonas sp. PCH199]PAM82308.1 FAD-binding oxidoreductase [Pseudomonas sp. ERMR1:02]
MQSLIASLLRIVGPKGLVHGADLSMRLSGKPQRAEVLVRPADTGEVSAVLAACHAAGVAVVPHGGLTGLVHGADSGPDEVILTLERMRRIETVDTSQRTLVAEAGVVLEVAQAAAAAACLSVPVDLGARGSATLGGMVATNAGGNSVLRHGMMRDNVLGLEVVLADGTVIDSMNPLVKNNTGYDIKQLFIGSEGTLGVVTRVVLRLLEAPCGYGTALLGLPDFACTGPLLRRLDQALDGRLSSFEVMWPEFYRAVSTPPAAGRPPLSHDHGLYALVEASSRVPEHDEGFASILSELMEQGLIADATLANNERERQALWALRDDVAQLRHAGPLVAYDISLPLADTGDYVERLRGAILARWPAAHCWAFGHLGDGNVHVAVHVPDLSSDDRQVLDSLVYSPLQALRGSVSAEHGIGLEKKSWLGISRNPTEIALMRALKHALDPTGVLNPGRIFDLQRSGGQR